MKGELLKIPEHFIKNSWIIMITFIIGERETVRNDLTKLFEKLAVQEIKE